jgi:hypothetical protein
MNEVIEMISSGARGAALKIIRRSLGFNRNTIRKYMALA